LLLVTGSASTLFTDSRYTFQAREEVTGARARIVKQGLLRAVGDALRGRRSRVAYAASRMSVAEKQSLDAQVGRGIRWVADANLVEKLRAVKDATELATIREAAVVVSDVFRRTLALTKPDISELELAAEIDYGIKRSGGSGPSFETIVASG